MDTLGNPLNPAAVRSFNVFSDVKDPNRTGIDPTWVGPQYLTRMPLPNNYQGGDGLNTAIFQWLRPEAGFDGSTGSSPNTNRNHLTARIDYQFNSRNKVNFTMTREKDWGVFQRRLVNRIILPGSSARSRGLPISTPLPIRPRSPLQC